MLNAYWPVIWEIIMPVMPLIQCYASKQSDLGTRFQKIYKNIYSFDIISVLQAKL